MNRLTLHLSEDEARAVLAALSSSRGKARDVAEKIASFLGEDVKPARNTYRAK